MYISNEAHSLVSSQTTQLPNVEASQK